MINSVMLIPRGNTSFSIYANNVFRSMKKLVRSSNDLNVKAFTVDIPHWNLLDVRFSHIIFAKKTLTFFIKSLGLSGDILHLPVHSYLPYLPVLKKRFKYTILTFHDLLPYLPQFPEHKEHPMILALERKNLHYVDHFIAISNNTKKDLCKLFGIPEERVSVVYNGVNHEIFYPRKDKRPLDYPYILYVGSEYPRKNMITIIKALYKLKKKYPKEFGGVKLVKVGVPEVERFGKMTIDVINKLDMHNDVIFTGYVREEDLPYYYSHAEVFVYPSLYEGFGLPPLEAMACGCPVITSNTSSLPEVVGNAGIMVNPLNIDELVKAIYDVITDESLKNSLKKKGLKRAKKFSWEKTASNILEIYKNVVYSYEK